MLQILCYIVYTQLSSSIRTNYIDVLLDLDKSLIFCNIHWARWTTSLFISAGLMPLPWSLARNASVMQLIRRKLLFWVQKLEASVHKQENNDGFDLHVPLLETDMLTKASIKKLKCHTCHMSCHKPEKGQGEECPKFKSCGFQSHRLASKLSFF